MATPPRHLPLNLSRPPRRAVFFVRNCPAVDELLRRAYAKTHLLHHAWWEQAAIIETIREGVPGLRVKIVPRHLFNAFACDYREEDFMIHFAGLSHAERIKAIRRRAAPILFPMPNHFRPGTNDREIFDQVVGQNEYRLEDDMEGAIVLDVGAHIGIFAYACCVRGAAEIWSVEAHPENFAILERNLAEMLLPGLRVPIFGAAWRSDMPGTLLRIHHGDWVNRGGRCLTQGDGAETILIPFDDIVGRVTRNGKRRIDLLKLDCEAAEFPILFTSRALSSVDKICAEIHPWMGHAPEFHVKGHDNNQAGLRRRLESQGFRVTIHGNHLWAQRLVPVPADR